jgi:hypothetical protein
MVESKTLSVSESEKQFINSLLELQFPNLVNGLYEIISEQTNEYNCIAWAAGDTESWWWPIDKPLCYWPQGIVRTESVECFVLAFESIGYSICANDHLENGFEKVAIYADRNRIPTHMARQLDNGLWSSKLGTFEDIEHPTLSGLTGSEYGSVVQILRRTTRDVKSFTSRVL